MKRIVFLYAMAIAVWLVVMLLFACGVRCYGQTMNDRSEAACKANKLYLEKCWQQGVTARIPCGTMYLRDTAETPITIGCGRIETNGSGGYWIPADHPTLAGKTSRICQLTPRIPALLLRGAGFIINGPIYLEGQGDGAAIVVEGRSVGVATGHHRLRDLCFYNWRQCCKTLAGYYNQQGVFVKDENHADNTEVSGIALNCDTLFRSENQQSLNWKINCFWQGTTKNGKAVALDIDRGGSVTANIVVETCPCTILKIADYSDNQCKFDIDLWIDSMVHPDPSFVLVELAKPELYWAQWFIDMHGWVGKQAKPIPDCLKFNVPANMNRTGWTIDLDYVGKKGPK